MGKGFTKFIGVANSIAMGITIFALLNEVFGDGRWLI